MNRLVYFAPLVAFAVIAAYFLYGLGRDPGYIPSMLIDRPAPQFSLPPIEGRTDGLSTEDLAGRVSLVNVFGSWCVACEIEHPVLLAIEAEGLAPVFGVDWKDRPGAGAAWLEQRGDPYARIGDDQDGRVAIEFGVTGAPETFIIDASGRVRHKHVGPITPELWRTTLRPMIEDLKDAPSE